MKAVWALVGFLGVGGVLAAAQAAPRRRAAVASPAAADPARALRCWDLGTTFGSAFHLLDPRVRARGAILENYCAARPDPALKRVPTDDDVAAIEREITRAVGPSKESMEQKAKVKTGPLDAQIEKGVAAESNMLDELLK